MRIFTLISALFLVNACQTAAISAVTGAGYIAAQDRGTHSALSDASIGTQISKKYFDKDINNLYHDIDIDVFEGRVLLTGSVDEPKYKHQAEEIAQQVAGVTRVINELQVAGAQDPISYAEDAWITSSLKGKLLVDKNVRSINYNIDTVNSVVYLFGIAQSQSELDQVTDIASRIKGVKQVVSHVRIKTPEEIAREEREEKESERYQKRRSRL